jgi:hypothetical protein
VLSAPRPPAPRPGRRRSRRRRSAGRAFCVGCPAGRSTWTRPDLACTAAITKEGPASPHGGGVLAGGNRNCSPSSPVPPLSSAKVGAGDGLPLRRRGPATLAADLTKLAAYAAPARQATWTTPAAWPVSGAGRRRGRRGGRAVTRPAEAGPLPGGCGLHEDERPSGGGAGVGGRMPTSVFTIERFGWEKVARRPGWRGWFDGAGGWRGGSRRPAHRTGATQVFFLALDPRLPGVAAAGAAPLHDARRGAACAPAPSGQGCMAPGNARSRWWRQAALVVGLWPSTTPRMAHGACEADASARPSRAEACSASALVERRCLHGSV